MELELFKFLVTFVPIIKKNHKTFNPNEKDSFNLSC